MELIEKMFVFVGSSTETYSAVVSVIIFLLIVGGITLVIVLPHAVIKSKYTKFVNDHSVGLKTLKKINKNYHFVTIPSFDMSHEYDNEIFYEKISCRDYLTYQLVYLKKQVKEAIDDSRKNKKLFDKYVEEIKEKCSLKVFDTEELPKNRKRLEKYESKIFLKTCYKPDTELIINVLLTNVKMNGVTKNRKRGTFHENVILEIIDDLNDRKGNFYRNEHIWNAICRVERGKVSNKMRFAIYERDHYRCRRCGRRTKDLEVDHIIPIAKGGKSTFDNLQTLCHRCNSRKGTDTIRY